MNIVLIDDEPFSLKILSRQLTLLGYDKVTTFERGYDALTTIKSNVANVDLIFCDLQMPEMDGVEFIRNLGHSGYSGGLVLISGEDGRILQTAEMLAKAQQLHVLGVLQKPVTPVLLKQILTEKYSGFNKWTTSFNSKSYQADELLWAIADGQLVNYYQPKVDVSSGTIIGVEALIRWLHPSDGIVLPSQFIPTALEHDLIDDLTRTVLASALHQARLWHDAGLPLQIAINIPIEHLNSLDFPDYIERVVKKSRLPLSTLLLEVTETGLMNHSLPSLDILTRLRLKHVVLSIDDFGSHHASLTQLRNIPFDEIKINRTFVHGASKDPSLKAIFMASLELARQLEMKTVAEGVEDLEDWDFVRASGCDMAQGFFIGRPMPAADFADWMLDWEDRQRDLLVYPDEISSSQV